jgi:exodeoxyribonuclease VII small subunit
MARSKAKGDGASFEQAIGQLEAIVRRLEEEEISLDEALKAYEEGLKLQRACEARLREAENRVRQLAEAADGKIAEEDFEPQADEADAPGETDEADDANDTDKEGMPD